MVSITMLAVIAAAALIVIAFGGGLVGTANLFTASISGGFSTVSIDNAGLSSFSSQFNGPTWILTVRQGGLAQYATGTFTGSQINDDGTTAKNSLKIDLENTKQSCNYPIDWTGNDYSIWELQYKIYPNRAYDIFFDSEAQCIKDTIAANGVRITQGTLGTSPDAFCLWKSKRAEIAPLRSLPTQDFETKIKVTAGTEYAEGIISNKNANAVQVGTNVFAQWQGNLQTGDQCPGTQNVKAMYANGWKTINQQNYDNYKNTAQSIESSLKGPVFTFIGTSDFYNKVSQWNDAANIAQLGYAFQSDGGSTAQSFGTLTAGTVRIDLTRAIFFPLITMYIKADTLGIVTPVAEPKIIGTSYVTFKTGLPATVPITVQNIGKERGEFSVSITCPSDISQTGSAVTKTLESGETFTAYVPVTGTSVDKITRECTTYARVLDKVATGKAFVTVDPQIICQANALSCENDAVVKCNAAGSAQILIQDCKLTNQICQPSGTAPMCVDKFQPIPEPVPVNNFILLLIGGIIIGGVGAVLLRVVPGSPLMGYTSNLKGFLTIMLIIAVVIVALFTPFVLEVANIAVGNIA